MRLIGSNSDEGALPDSRRSILVITAGFVGMCLAEIRKSRRAYSLLRGSSGLPSRKRTPCRVGNTTDHVLRFIKSSGVDKSAGPTAFLDGATETEVLYGDDDRGSGAHHGYIFYTASDGTLLNEFDGYTTTVTVDEKGRFVSGGSWHTVSGTGRYGGGTGIGTYSSEGGLTHWEGTFITR